MSEKLLPCPFCGNPPQNDEEDEVWCATTGCDFIQTFSLESWNTRPAPPDLREAEGPEDIATRNWIKVSDELRDIKQSILTALEKLDHVKSCLGDEESTGTDENQGDNRDTSEAWLKPAMKILRAALNPKEQEKKA